MKIKSLLLFVALFATVNSFGQLITFSGQLGYASPQGDAFADEAGEKLTSFGIGYDADLLYCLDQFDQKIGVGIMYSGAALFGSESSEGVDIGIYGLALYGVKGQYRLLAPDKKVSPTVR